MEEDSLCVPLRKVKVRPSWSIGLRQHHTTQSLSTEEKIILDRQLGNPTSLKTLTKGAIRTILNKLSIEQNTSLTELSQQLPLPDLLKEYIVGK